ncbi:MAG: HD domain-containing protein [Armatimonadetes bacterium]|nr:HD domain-containing protein [Armatimonadota bacterium]
MDEHILVIDSDEPTREALEISLKDGRYRVDAVKDIPEAILTSKQKTYDLVLYTARGSSRRTSTKKAQEGTGYLISGFVGRDAFTHGIKKAVEETFPVKDRVEVARRIGRRLEDYGIRKQGLSLRKKVEEEYLAALRTISSSLESRNSFRSNHSLRVTRLALGTARVLGLDADRTALAGPLHDLGYLKVPEAVLGKPGLLTPEEYEQVKLHPAAVVEILQPLECLRKVIPIILYHHERPDGAGYPDGLKGDEIPLESRVLAVCDAFESLTSSRPHRDAFSQDEALRILREGKSVQFDAQAVEALISLVSNGSLEEKLAAIQVRTTEGHLEKGFGLLNLGYLLLEIEEYAGAQDVFEELMGAHQEPLTEEVSVLAMLGMASLYSRKGLVEDAETLTGGALHLAKESGMGGLLGKALVAAGSVLFSRGKPEEGKDLLIMAFDYLDLWPEHFYDLVQAYYLLSNYHFRKEEQAQFLDYLEKALTLAERLGFERYFLRAEGISEMLPEMVKSKKKTEYCGKILELVGGSVVELESLPHGKAQERRQVLPLRIYGFGPFRVFRGDELIQEEEWKTKKSKSLFAYLVSNNGRPVSEDRLLDMFWPNVDVDKARKSLYTTVYRLRRALEPHLAEGGTSNYIVFKRNYYCFNVESKYWLDVEEFERHVKLAQLLSIQGNEEEAIGEYQKADRLYAADYLDDNLDDEWPLYHRDRLRKAYLKSLIKLAEYLANKGAFETGIHYCQKIFAFDRAREDAHFQMMRCLWGMGRRDEAVRQYHLCTEVLKKDLNLTPNSETVKLYLQIVEGKVFSPTAQ